MISQNKKLVLCALAALTMTTAAACGSKPAAPETTAAPTAAAAETTAAPETTAASETTAAAETIAAPETTAASETTDASEAGALTLTAANGMKLTVPAEYSSLVVYDTPADSPDGVLFSVYEKASVEAAKAQALEYDGAGWLFDIRRISEDELHEMLCYDMSGQEPFAKDADGNYYAYCHPTDVRVVRESYDNEEDMKNWSDLCEWANTAEDSFIAENEGLTKETCGNSTPEMLIARTMWMKDTKYDLNYLEFGELDPKDVDPAPFAGRLLDGAVYEMAETSEAPDGEYYILEFPETEERLDFFLMDAEKSYVRHVWMDEENAELYTITFEDKDRKASEIMAEWYQALAEANGKTKAN